jgi:hypothetical protein
MTSRGEWWGVVERVAVVACWSFAIDRESDRPQNSGYEQRGLCACCTMTVIRRRDGWELWRERLVEGYAIGTVQGKWRGPMTYKTTV